MPWQSSSLELWTQKKAVQKLKGKSWFENQAVYRSVNQFQDEIHNLKCKVLLPKSCKKFRVILQAPQSLLQTRVSNSAAFSLTSLSECTVSEFWKSWKTGKNKQAHIPRFVRMRWSGRFELFFSLRMAPYKNLPNSNVCLCAKTRMGWHPHRAIIRGLQFGLDALTPTTAWRRSRLSSNLPLPTN